MSFQCDIPALGLEFFASTVLWEDIITVMDIVKKGSCDDTDAEVEFEVVVVVEEIK